MTTTRRHFLASAAAGAGMTLIPFRTRAEGHMASGTFETPGGTITVHPVNHASIVFETPVGVIYADPVGEAALYEGMPAPDLILITHEHGDHYNVDTLNAVGGDDTPIIANPAVFAMLPEEMQGRATELANGDSTEALGITIEAIPAYNITEGRLDYHPQGRDNGYVLGFEEYRVYISGDTEDTEEMRALENIDLAFVSMNLPFTMDIESAASGIDAFAPTYVYPYHYRGRDGGTQDPNELQAMLTGETEVQLAPWYDGEIMPSS